MNPDQFTIGEHYIEVGDGHALYVQDWGNNRAKIPILFLHGGPGSGTRDSHKQTFDPTLQRVIFFDQRGAGKSIPKGSLEHNSTDKLIEDVETIVTHLKLNQFIITGGSWGSLLALAYTIKHPKRVKAMVLRGIFTGRKQEIAYVDGGEFKRFFPDAWQSYLDKTPKTYHKSPSKYHYERVFGEDAEAAKASAYAYAELESALLSLDDRHMPIHYEEFDPDPMRIELHYLRHGCFMPDNHIMDNAHKLTMPIWLVQGRYDMVCPPFTAYELHQKLPNSHLIWTTAGHSNDRANYDVTRTILLQMVTQKNT